MKRGHVPVPVAFFVLGLVVIALILAAFVIVPRYIEDSKNNTNSTTSSGGSGQMQQDNNNDETQEIECGLTNAYWKKGPQTLGVLHENDEVELVLLGENCTGKEVTFTVLRNTGEEASGQPDKTIFNSGQAVSSWTVESGEVFGYYFKAQVEEDSLTFIGPLMGLNFVMNLTQCEDNIDNDNDGLPDWLDPGCFYSDNLQEQGESEFSEEFVAYSWSDHALTEGIENIVPFYWLRGNNIGAFGSNQVAQEAKEATDAMPQGEKAIFIWNDLARDINTNDLDVVINSQGETQGHTTQGGNFVPYRDVWWENGRADVKNQINSFFEEYKQIGGEVDVIILDVEVGMSNWALNNIANTKYESSLDDQNRIDYYLAIQNDPRYSEIQQELSFSDILYVANYLDFRNTAHEYDYLEWNELMYDRLSEFYKESIYNPIKSNYPSIRLNEYNHHYWSDDFPVPDRNGHPIYLRGDGTHTGTYQTRAIYGQGGNVYGGRPPEGVDDYPYTKFNSFRYHVNQIRSVALSSDVPFAPWISHKGWQDSILRDNDYYQELIYHTVLTNLGYFLYWNPPNAIIPADQEDDQLVSNLLKKSDKLIGYSGKNTLVSDISEWTDDYVLSGMESGGRKVWRLTFEGDINVDEGEDLTFSTNDFEIAFPEGVIYESQYSSQGYWVIQPLDKSPIISEI